ncbi:MAG: PEGA domain-containing protein [Chitinispirillia bacterium]|nr:PEGA domain-containing protein [Chitinispirillia bacterium]MCL2241458.1 PEGA domain-containing protein [Chitinispirillia bacterium]
MSGRIFALLTFFCLALAPRLSAQLPDPYSIAAFNVTGREFPERNNFVIKNPRNISPSDTLPGIGSPPPFIRPGQVVMRKKFGADYRLYLGDLDTTAFRAFPPIYAFPIPSWSRSGQAMWYRFYTKITTNRNLDLETVFFDNERMYIQHHSKVYYSRNDEWDSIAGAPATPWGQLQIDSDPPGADIYLYGKPTGKKTPAVLRNMLSGRYEVELFLPDYRFQRRSVSVPDGGTAVSSFQMMSDFDTLLVLGERQHGVLVLPFPPIDSAYFIDDTLKAAFQEELLEGDYRLTWNGGGLYKDIDTVITIPPGQMVYFNVPFVRLGGQVAFYLFPQDALLCIEGLPCGPGGTTVDLPSGFHTVRFSRFGYEPERRKFIVSHGKKSIIRVQLRVNADRDSDGFPDSLDRCPDVYGLYDGCPKPDLRTSFMMKYEELIEYMETEPFTFAVSGISYISRNPTNRRFHNFMASFSGGYLGGMNNYQGIALGNIYQLSARGFMAQVELGQWASGIKYRRPDTLTIRTGRDRYLVWYDSLFQIDPAIFLPSTAVSVGFKYRLNSYSVGYSLGFQWEDIIIDEIERLSDRKFQRVQFDNDWWFHEIMLEADLFMDTFMSPSLYGKFKFPFGPTMRTKWHSFQIGLQFRVRPANWGGRG